MPTLNSILEDPQRSVAIADLSTFAEKTAQNQSGMTGMTLKTGLKAARKVDSEIVPRGVTRLLPDVVEALNPLWQDYSDSAEEQDFGVYLGAHSAQAIDALLAVADRHAEKLGGPLGTAYSALRGKASKIIEPTLPELGAILEKHAV
ncbi:DUF6918 family protein [Corynebacterium sp. 21KM1197]|uniref:DUF6918 family protein n=1 Tax=Corynebacterium sp. 21KM1197 TaxID=2989734 RepID=UPI0029CA8A03|nr:hypothetical protein [Corynebacterium sp. 21KM1197]WPF68659.1 hypothetical protein OLW90_00040 [Corynebacterium sp. 21KM1197]